MKHVQDLDNTTAMKSERFLRHRIRSPFKKDQIAADTDDDLKGGGGKDKQRAVRSQQPSRQITGV